MIVYKKNFTVQVKELSDSSFTDVLWVETYWYPKDSQKESSFLPRSTFSTSIRSNVESVNVRGLLLVV